MKKEVCLVAVACIGRGNMYTEEYELKSSVL